MTGKPARITNKMVVEAVKNNELDEKQLDSIVKDLLRVVFMGQNTEDKFGDQNIEQHHQLARKVAAEAMTLLKNTKKLLPVDTSKYKKIAILGEFAVNPRYQGNGSSQVKPTKLDKFIDIVRQEYGQDIEITYSAGYSLENDDDLSLVQAAAEVAADAD